MAPLDAICLDEPPRDAALEQLGDGGRATRGARVSSRAGAFGGELALRGGVGRDAAWRSRSDSGTGSSAPSTTPRVLRSLLMQRRADLQRLFEMGVVTRRLADKRGWCITS